MPLPPGPTFLAKLLPTIVVPPLFTYAAVRSFEKYASTSIPTWAVVVLVLGAKPIHIIATTYSSRVYNWREANKRGARTVPYIEEPWPYFTGLSIVPKLVDMCVNGYVLDVMPPWMEKYGNFFELRLPTETQIWTTEPEHIKAILANQFNNFEKGPTLIQQLGGFLGTGIFNSDGEMWKLHRGITRPFFSKDRISDSDLFDKHTDQSLSLAKARLAEGYSIDFQDLVGRFTLDSAGQFLFGVDIESLSAGIPYPPTSGRLNPTSFTHHKSNIFVNAFFKGLHYVNLRTIVGREWPLTEFFSDKVQTHRKVMDAIIGPVVRKAIDERSSEDLKGGEDKTLLQQLVEQTQDQTVILDELINLLVAGRDTTACTLSFSVYMMAENPSVTARLREEILSKVGEKGRPSYQDIRDMKYLRAFINEVLRLYPPVPFNVRSSIKDTVFATKDGTQPVFIPGNTQIGYSVWNMHRRKDLWGPDAEEFDPDRFLDDRLQKYLIPNPFIFTPFNAGPRICLGQQFAYHEASFFLIRLLQQFSKFHLALNDQPQDTLAPASWAECGGTKGREKLFPGTNLTLYIKGGLWVRME